MIDIAAWPTSDGSGYHIAGSGTYAAKEKIKAAGGRWNATAKRWFVTRDQARAAKIPVMVRVHRSPVCCEKNMGRDSFMEYATADAAAAGKMAIRFCPYCDSHVNAEAKIVGLVGEEVPS